MLLGGTSIHSTQIGQPEKLRNIRVADDFKIPARCEIIIDVFIDRFDEDPPSQLHNFILEPNDDFIQNFPVTMAPTLVDIRQDVTNKVRIMNPFDQEYVLRQDTILGKAEQLENEPYLLFKFEDYEEISNHAPVRRIKFQERGGPLNWETNVVVIRNISKRGLLTVRKVKSSHHT